MAPVLSAIDPHFAVRPSYLQPLPVEDGL
jgi:hypothetical protein